MNMAGDSDIMINDRGMCKKNVKRGQKGFLKGHLSFKRVHIDPWTD